MTGPVILIAVFVAGLASANYASNTRQSDSSWGVARRTGTVDSERLPLGLAARRRANLPTYPGYSADDRKEGTRKRRGRPTRRPHLSAKTERPTLPPKLQSAQYPPQDPAGSDQQQPPPAPTPPAYPYPGGTPPHPGRPYPPPVQSLPPQYPPAPQYPRGPYYPQGRPQYPGNYPSHTPSYPHIPQGRPQYPGTYPSRTPPYPYFPQGRPQYPGTYPSRTPSYPYFPQGHVPYPPPTLSYPHYSRGPLFSSRRHSYTVPESHKGPVYSGVTQAQTVTENALPQPNPNSCPQQPPTPGQAPNPQYYTPAYAPNSPYYTAGYAQSPPYYNTGFLPSPTLFPPTQMPFPPYYPGGFLQPQPYYPTVPGQPASPFPAGFDPSNYPTTSLPVLPVNPTGNDQSMPQPSLYQPTPPYNAPWYPQSPQYDPALYQRPPGENQPFVQPTQYPFPAGFQPYPGQLTPFGPPTQYPYHQGYGHSAQSVEYNPATGHYIVHVPAGAPLFKRAGPSEPVKHPPSRYSFASPYEKTQRMSALNNLTRHGTYHPHVPFSLHYRSPFPHPDEHTAGYPSPHPRAPGNYVPRIPLEASYPEEPLPSFPDRNVPRVPPLTGYYPLRNRYTQRTPTQLDHPTESYPSSAPPYPPSDKGYHHAHRPSLSGHGTHFRPERPFNVADLYERNRSPAGSLSSSPHHSGFSPEYFSE
ncbi:basic salivary proline-rich protein 1-like isoform X1 [Ornithodoros turicata]|uniref:basic salivary proline-rich protein 1-like isoform X1 n=1 Tax=Ornithodoros turicata TaxID=34597 RepID=UPI003138F5B4